MEGFRAGRVNVSVRPASSSPGPLQRPDSDSLPCLCDAAKEPNCRLGEEVRRCHSHSTRFRDFSTACQCMRFALELGIGTSKASIRTIGGRIVASLRCVTGPSLPDQSALSRASVLDCQSQTNQHCQPTQRCQTRTSPRSSEFILVKPSPAKKLSYSTSLIASGWAF